MKTRTAVYVHQNNTRFVRIWDERILPELLQDTDGNFWYWYSR